MSISSGSYLVDLLGILVATVAIFYAFFKWTFEYWKRRNVPYLEPKVPFGNFMNPFTKTISEGDQISTMYMEAKARGFDYCGIYAILGAPHLLIVDLELVKRVLVKNFENFTDRGFYYNEKDDPISGHLFAIGGAKWKNLRAKLSPTFTSGKMKTMFQTLAKSGQVLENFVKENVNATVPVDIKDVLGRYSTDIIGSCAFGIDCNSFKEPNSPFRVYGKRVFQDTNLDSLRIAFCQSLQDLSRALGLSTIDKGVSKFYNKMAEDVVNYREKNNVTRKDFMQLLIDMKNNKQDEDGLRGDGKKLTMEEISAQSFIFFLAGFETSSTTATFALFELATNPEIQDNVRQEINKVLANHNNEITYDSLSELKYMKQVIDETLRKYPALPFITRRCVKDFKVPEYNLVVEKGTLVMVSIQGIHHDTEHYENPEKFDPDRFTDENKKKINPYAHIPFGEGPRICIGERFGIMQTKIALTSILRNFKVKVHHKTQLPLRMSPRSIVSATIGDIWLTFDKI